MQDPTWLTEIKEKARPAFQAFGEDIPACFVFFSDEESFFDWPDLFDIPVYDANNGLFGFLHCLYNEPEECPLVPLWSGEMTGKRQLMTREFYDRYTRSGDY